MTDIVARLDRQLAKKGETVTIQRRIGDSLTAFAEITARVRLTGYSGSEVQGAVQVTDSKFVMSPTPFTGAAWPGAAGGINYPAIGDFMITQGRKRRIEQAERVKVGDVVVRIEGRVRG